MRILSIETSGRTGSIALLEANQGLATLRRETHLAGPQRTAQLLAPAIKDLLAEIGWPAGSIELVAAVVGPGSFTGLRIGVTTAKTIAYAVGAKVAAVHTLDVLAAQAPADDAPLWAILDAQRQELFAARFSGRGTNRPQMIGQTQIISAETWLADLQPGDRVTGPALGRLAARLPAGVAAAPAEAWQPMARAAGLIGWAMFQQGQNEDVWTLAPQYYRPSAAEEKLETRRRGDKENA